MNIQTVLTNQQEIIRLLRGLSSRSTESMQTNIEDLIPVPLTKVDDLGALCTKVHEENGFRDQLVIDSLLYF